jgi:hypothetical protein
MSLNSEQTLAEVKENVSFILGHFNEPIFPRRIFTPSTKQIVVDNIIDILVYFRKANFIDCRVSAYPYRERWEAILHGEEPPDTLFIDLDFNQFKSKLALDRTLHKTLKNIKVKLCCPEAKPSIPESGSGGYHIIQPLKAIDLKRVDYFMKWSADPNKEFIRFLEPYLSGNRADPNHYQNVSFNNCLLRVPGSINSKSGKEIKIMQRWNGIRPDIKYLYGNFLAYLIDNRTDKYRSRSTGSNWFEYCKDGSVN